MISSLHTTYLFFFFNDTATTEIYTLSLHDALPILIPLRQKVGRAAVVGPDRLGPEWLAEARRGAPPRGRAGVEGGRHPPPPPAPPPGPRPRAVCRRPRRANLPRRPAGGRAPRTTAR